MPSTNAPAIAIDAILIVLTKPSRSSWKFSVTCAQGCEMTASITAAVERPREGGRCGCSAHRARGSGAHRVGAGASRGCVPERVVRAQDVLREAVDEPRRDVVPEDAH